MIKGEHLDDCIDNITNLVMDEIRDVLAKYETHLPEWNSDRIHNLDDTIYGAIHAEVRYTLDPPEPYEYVSPDEHLSTAFCDAIKKHNDGEKGSE